MKTSALPGVMIGANTNHRRKDMARKKIEGNKEMATTTESPLKPVRVEFAEDVHRMLRKLAADEDTSMASFARETLERVIREEFKKRGLK
jgi:hypothetical protein